MAITIYQLNRSRMTFPCAITRQYVPVDVAGHPGIAAYIARMEARRAYQRCRAIVDGPAA